MAAESIVTEAEELRYAELQQMALDFARDGEARNLSYMIDAGLPVNLADHKGNTLLMLAAYHGQAEVVSMLLQNGADPERRNARGQTPLAGVAFKGNVEVARLLIDGGADATSPCTGGQTPIQFAAMFGQLEMYKLLLEKGGVERRVLGIPAGALAKATSCIRRTAVRMWPSRARSY